MSNYISTSSNIYNRDLQLAEFAFEEGQKEETNVFHFDGKYIYVYFDGDVLFYVDNKKRDYCSIRSTHELLEILEQSYHYDLYGTYGNFAERHFYPKGHDIRQLDHNVKHWQVNNDIIVIYRKDKENYECTNSKLLASSTNESTEELLDTLKKWSFKEEVDQVSELERYCNLLKKRYDIW